VTLKLRDTTKDRETLEELSSCPLPDSPKQPESSGFVDLKRESEPERRERGQQLKANKQSAFEIVHAPEHPSSTISPGRQVTGAPTALFLWLAHERGASGLIRRGILSWLARQTHSELRCSKRRSPGPLTEIP